jgi:crotonobetainyl-CoA:carnitine CoA-transferase CaiB-like acyl-CoA transferase
MSGMGEGGPWSKFVTYAPTIHALSGLTHMTSVPGREDIGIGFSYNDHQAGLHGVVVLLAALEARRISGRGQRIDMSQFEMGVNFSGPALLDLFANGRAAQPTGNRLPYDVAAPHNCYPCEGEERWVAISVMDDEQWRAFRLVMGDPDWARADCYRNATSRVANLETLDAQVSAWTRTLRAERVQELCQTGGVPAGVVQNGIDLAEHDPQLRLRDFLIELDDPHPAIGATYADRLPLHFEKTPANVYRRSRVIGEDNAAVLGEWLGMTKDEVRRHEDDDTLR